ncbi:hypothetical protein MNBD_CHLOROFLEXI01-3433 [hydrothermal vent metagenome]|uniref:YfhO family protein n=1 Tax=hydrothermal vent metagenome TaxID=652676 RepID=A0A3B0V234_9ZZZZ
MSSVKRLIQHPWIQVILTLILIATLTYLFLWRLWAAAPEDRAYLPEKSDLAEVFYPPRYYFAQNLEAGQFSLWNPHIYAGYPQFADPQAATFYPIALLFARFAGASYSMDSIALNIGLHYFLVGAFTFLFFRHIMRSNLAALLGALVFEFGGYLTFYPPLQLSELEVVAWLPLTLLLITLSLQRRNWLLLAVAGVTMGQVFLAGRPQSYLTIGLITIAWLIYTAHQEKYLWFQIGARIVALTGFALGISAAQWLPTLQLTRLSTRSVLIYDFVAEGGFPFAELTGFFVPQMLGTQNLYMGLLTLLLAGVAIYKRKGLFWVGILLVSLIGSVGDNLILFDSLYLIERLGFPGYLRNVERLAFGITFSLAALSGYGLCLLQKEAKQLLRFMAISVGGIFSVTLLMAWFWSFTRLPTESLDPILAVETISFAGMMLLVALGALWLLRDQPKIAAVAFVVIAVLDVMSINQGRFFVAESFLPGNDIERAAAAPAGPDTFYRVAFDQTSSQDFGSLAGVDSPGGMPPLMLKDYERLRGVLTDEYRRNILLNVGMVVTTGEYTDPAFELVAQQDNFNYYRFLHFKPRAYLVEEVIEVADAVEAAERLAAPDFDYWNTALVVGESGLGQGSVLLPTENVLVVGRTANSITIQATTEEPRLLVLSDTFYPGWQAEIDNVSTEILQTNVALRGVVVPSGNHTITMQFRPLTFYLGVAISLLTVLVVLLWAGFNWLRS